MMKQKMIAFVLTLAIIIGFVPTGVSASSSVSGVTSISIGDYFTLGTYYGEPIVWRCVDIDENGPLMLSDKILCLKSYDAAWSGHSSSYRQSMGTNNWNDSCLRTWLNSEDQTVKYSMATPDAASVYKGYNAYDAEAGFLTNFTASELAQIKPVTQKTYLNSLDASKAKGGSSKYDIGYIAFSSLPTSISGKWYDTSEDRIFLLGPEQAAAVYKNLGEDYLLAKPTVAAVANSEMKNSKFSENLDWHYWLRLPMNTGMSYQTVSIVTENKRTESSCANGLDSDARSYPGVRPAFYLDTERTKATSYIVDEVKQYTSGSLYAQLYTIMNTDYTEEERYYRLTELFLNNGITDVKEGIQYLSNATSKRRAYAALTTDELYCASNFEYMLNHTPKGLATRTVLMADGLVFNNEIYSWLNPLTYTGEKDLPGVAKYKDMLYDFMDSVSFEIETMEYINLVEELTSNATSGAELYANNIINQLNNCKSRTERNRIMMSADAMGIYQDVKVEGTNMENYKLSFSLSETSGFGKFVKATGYASTALSVASMTIEHVINLVELSGKLAVYNQYRDFLSEIRNASDLPWELRLAAHSILLELDDGAWGEIQGFALDLVAETGVLGVLKDSTITKVLGAHGAEVFGEYLIIIAIESWCINKIADVGALVKGVSYVEGYSYLSSYYKNKLETIKGQFLQNPSEANAWSFFENYNILYRLRIKGEEAYLSMSKVKGLSSYFTDFGYSLKEAVAGETISLLKNQCRFTLDSSVSIPESIQYVSKMVINCPVDVTVRTAAGDEIAILKDGVESDITNEYGRFTVILQPYTNEYAKVLCFSTDAKLDISLTGVDDGLVDCEMASSEPNTDILTFDKVAIGEGDILVMTNEIADTKDYTIYKNGNDNPEPSVVLTSKKSDEYHKVEAIEIQQSQIEMFIGDEETLQVRLLPINASNTVINWTSSDSEVAIIKNGVVTAVGEGTATIYASPIGGDNLQAEVSVLVQHSHTLVATDAIAATCETAGNIAYWKCDDCEKLFSDGSGTTEILLADTIIPAHGHKYAFPVWTWAEDHSTVSATFICTGCDDTQVVNATVTEQTADPTHTQAGQIVYTAKVIFNDVEYSDTANVSIPAIGHTYGTPTWNWSSDYSTTTATFACTGGDDTQVVDAGITSQTTTATPTEDGAIVYTAITTFGGKEYTDTQTVVIPATGEPTNLSFVDVTEDSWFYAAVYHCFNNGYFKGVSNNQFAPNDTMTRAMFATVLYRVAGEPIVTGENSFTDVETGKWYTDAVIWAASENIIEGYGNGKFGTNDSVTREQMVTLFWRYQGKPAVQNANLTAFVDTDDISEWAQKAFEWAISVSVINGKGNGILDPKGTATRAEVAQIVMNYDTKVG